MIEVMGTVRAPDGVVDGRIDGLVIQKDGQNTVVTLQQAIALAGLFQLYCTVPGDGQLVLVVGVDTNRDGVNDSVRTAPDKTTRNNLLELPIWDRKRGQWIVLDRTTGKWTSVQKVA